MNIIEHIYEPSRLLLTWHHSMPEKPRTNRIVGEIFKDAGQVSFKYLQNTDDYIQAKKEGFSGFPAFSVEKNQVFTEGVIDIFTRRLPSRRREDFAIYLKQYNLASNFNGSDFSLLAYTGARLTNDRFEIVPDLTDAKSPIDFIIKASGVHYYPEAASSCSEGDEVLFELEPTNEFDTAAVKIMCNNAQIGYVNKTLSSGFTQLIKKGTVHASLMKLTVSESKPIALILVKFR